MAVVNPGHVLENSNHSAEVARQHTASMLGAPVALLTPAVEVVAAGGSHGVVGYDDLKVSQNSTPNMTVQVAAGECFIRGSQQLDQGAYNMFNDGAVTGLTVTAAHATNARRDLVVAEVIDQAYSGADTFRLRVVAGTPAASPSDPSVPNNALVLARIQVDAAVTSIVDAKITDLRTYANAVGGIQRCKSTTRPNPVGRNQFIAENDTYKLLQYTTATTGWTLPWSLPWGLLGVAELTASSTAAGSTVIDVTSASITVTTVANRKLRIVGYARVQQSTNAVDTNEMYITDGSNNIKQTSSIGLGIAKYGVHHMEVVLNSAGGSETFKLRHATPAGTTNALGSSSQPVFVAVYDVGPAANPA